MECPNSIFLGGKEYPFCIHDDASPQLRQQVWHKPK